MHRYFRVVASTGIQHATRQGRCAGRFITAALLALTLAGGLGALPGTAPTWGATPGVSSPVAAQASAAPAQQPKAAQAPVVPATPRIWFKVSRFDLAYKQEHPSNPPLRPIMDMDLRLSKVREGYVAVQKSLGESIIRLAQISGRQVEDFDLSAINSICAQIVEGYFNKQGLVGVFIRPDQEQIVAEPGQPPVDMRPQNDKTLRLEIHLGHVEKIRTLASGDRLPQQSRIDHPRHAWVHEQSPVQERDLLNKEQIENYIFRMSRHPGRRVDVAIAAGNEPNGVVVDYLITETKPLLLYAQLSNTGTEQTDRFRQRFGLQYNQLTNFDDTISLDYITASFDKAHAVLGSYERPFQRGGKARWRVYGSWSQFTASDVGLAGEEFTGRSWTGGAEVALNVFQRRELFIDLFGGARWDHIEVNNPIALVQGEADLLVPTVGVRVEDIRPVAATNGLVALELVDSELTGTSRNDLERLGRLAPDDNWAVMRWDFTQTAFLEPLLSPRRWADPEAKGTKLAHEVLLAFRGQYAFENRLIPQAQQVAGGLYTVRGYPESTVAGDTVLVGTLEYRLHVPKVLPVREDPWTPPARSVASYLFGDSFRAAPQHAYGSADWDLILKAFLDAGRVIITDPFIFESDESLLSVGVGAEFVFRRNVNLRVDWGFVLDEIPGRVNDGSNRVHFVATFLF